jgi:hypothetical protein
MRRDVKPLVTRGIVRIRTFESSPSTPFRDMDGNIKNLPFAAINVHILQHTGTFTHPNLTDLLFATQFPQISLGIMSHTAFEDLRP